MRAPSKLYAVVSSTARELDEPMGFDPSEDLHTLLQTAETARYCNNRDELGGATDWRIVTYVKGA